MTTAILTPAEVFLGRPLQYKWGLPENAGNMEKVAPSKYSKQLKENMQRVKDFVESSRKDYLESLEDTDKHRKNELRRFEVGDEVTKYAPTGMKRGDKVAPLQGGPYRITKVGESGADY